MDDIQLYTSFKPQNVYKSLCFTLNYWIADNCPKINSETTEVLMSGGYVVVSKVMESLDSVSCDVKPSLYAIYVSGSGFESIFFL